MSNAETTASRDAELLKLMPAIRVFVAGEVMSRGYADKLYPPELHAGSLLRKIDDAMGRKS